MRKYNIATIEASYARFKILLRHMERHCKIFQGKEVTLEKMFHECEHEVLIDRKCDFVLTYNHLTQRIEYIVHNGDNNLEEWIEVWHYMEYYFGDKFEISECDIK